MPLACCLLAFTAMFLLSDVFNDLPDFLKSRSRGQGSLGQLVTFFLILQPLNMVHVLPMSILLSASFMTAMLSRHHEIAAIRAAGLSLFACGLPLWGLSLALSGVTLWISEGVAPQCAARAQQIRDNWTETADERRRDSRLAYHNAAGKRDWFFEQFLFNKAYRGILIRQFRADDTTEWELQAARAQYKHHQWIFYDGTRVFFDKYGKLPVGNDHPFTVLKKPDNLNLTETPRQILNHLRPVEELSIAGILRMFRYNQDIPRRTRQVFLTTIWYRLSFPLSCVVGALLGVALTASTERASTLQGFASAVGVMVLYYLVSQLGVVFGRNGYLPAALGGAGPTLAFLACGAVALYRKR